MLLLCVKLLELGLSERKEVLKQSGLCLYCLKHAAEMECYGRGGLSKPKCMQTGCDEEHAVGAHKLLRESGASVNLVVEGEYESEEDEEWRVSTVRIEEKEEEEGEECMEEIDDSGSERNRGREIWYLTSSHVRKDDSGLEDELEYFWEAPSPSDPYEREEDRWWSPGPLESSAEEDEEEVQYLTKVLGLEPKGDGVKEKEPSPPTRTMSGTKENRQAPSPRRHAEQSGGPLAIPRGAEPPRAKKIKRRKLRKKWRGTKTTSGSWRGKTPG
jgi:hypothetical protein